MKNKIILTMVTLGLAFPVVNLKAQEDGNRPDGPKDRPRVEQDGERPVQAQRRERLHRPENGPGRRFDAPERERSQVRIHRQERVETMGPRRGPGPGAQMRRPDRPGPMMAPLFGALDANHDGAIDREEIKQAKRSLRKLDRNGDRRITPDELRPFPMRRPAERGGRPEMRRQGPEQMRRGSPDDGPGRGRPDNEGRPGRERGEDNR